VPNHRTGLLIIRAWVEEGSTEPLRAQVRVTGDLSTGEVQTLTLIQSDAVGKVVGTWLQGIVGASGTPPEH
jgi:hypothetical protein